MNAMMEVEGRRGARQPTSRVASNARQGTAVGIFYGSHSSNCSASINGRPAHQGTATTHLLPGAAVDGNKVYYGTAIEHMSGIRGYVNITDKREERISVRYNPVLAVGLVIILGLLVQIGVALSNMGKSRRQLGCQ
ncbi:hypothetical protein LTR85_006558 [Meristemomyces frigidus]|nr:hypothetical protein LTR85_006558 [Meristemomyces frigidus]